MNDDPLKHKFHCVNNSLNRRHNVDAYLMLMSTPICVDHPDVDKYYGNRVLDSYRNAMFSDMLRLVCLRCHANSPTWQRHLPMASRPAYKTWNNKAVTAATFFTFGEVNEDLLLNKANQQNDVPSPDRRAEEETGNVNPTNKQFLDR